MTTYKDLKPADIILEKAGPTADKYSRHVVEKVLDSPRPPAPSRAPMNPIVIIHTHQETTGRKMNFPRYADNEVRLAQ